MLYNPIKQQFAATKQGFYSYCSLLTLDIMWHTISAFGTCASWIKMYTFSYYVLDCITI